MELHWILKMTNQTNWEELQPWCHAPDQAIEMKCQWLGERHRCHSNSRKWGDCPVEKLYDTFNKIGENLCQNRKKQKDRLKRNGTI